MGAALYHSAYVIIGGGILPTMIMTICACFIRQNLAHKQQRRMQIASTHRAERSFDQQVLKILFIQIIFYVLFIIPQLGNLVFNTISVTIPNRSADHLAIEQFVTFIAEFMLYLFPVTSFYLYTLTSRTFRKELMKYFRTMHIPCFRNRIVPTGVTTAVDHHLGNQYSMAKVMVKRTAS
jgi:H+/gluconate symporter-like permease